MRCIGIFFTRWGDFLMAFEFKYARGLGRAPLPVLVPIQGCGGSGVSLVSHIGKLEQLYHAPVFTTLAEIFPE